jgi:hypothetical protein
MVLAQLPGHHIIDHVSPVSRLRDEKAVANFQPAYCVINADGNGERSGKTKKEWQRMDARRVNALQS